MLDKEKVRQIIEGDDLCVAVEVSKDNHEYKIWGYYDPGYKKPYNLEDRNGDDISYSDFDSFFVALEKLIEGKVIGDIY
jgi:hypothetical protein